MSISTKKGDFGQTDLLKERVSKSDIRIHVVGSIDEAMAFILLPKHYIRIKEVHEDLNHIHHLLSQMSYEIVLDDENTVKINEEDVTFLNERKSYYQSFLEPLNGFILLDQTKAASFLNLARVTVRRVERYLVQLNEIKKINPNLLMLVNRLSDFLFTLARYFDELK